MRKPIGIALLISSLSLLAACGGQRSNDESLEEFIARINLEIAELGQEGAEAGWVQATYITQDTQAINARASERFLAWLTKSVEEAKRYDGEPMTPEQARALMLLKLGVAAPAPADAAKRAELAKLSAKLDADYGAAKYCPKGPESCKSVDALGEDLAATRNYDTALDIWTGWHDQAAPMRKEYQRFVELANEGARELGHADLGILWRSGYDMSAEEFSGVASKLYDEVKPLYSALHCYAGKRLAAQYGADKVREGEPLPAHLFGNMWAQQWNRIYDDLLMPYPKVATESADRALKAQKWDAVRMTKSAESFYTSLGMRELPVTFWERSMFTRPLDRDVLCHASAWQIDLKEDVRIKMCMQPTQEDLFTVYHELGHLYYDLYYKDNPPIFMGGAHDGFHEAIGDTVNLSVTPQYLSSIGLARPVKPSQEAVINAQMKQAVEKIAFLPFGKVVDEWRWRVFSGEVQPADYNKSWWELRRKYQGIAPAVTRDETAFDPGAKYHIPGNTPYTRYFLSFIIQFQFHKALCEAAGYQGPLHECSVFGNKQAGERFMAMLREGQSKPWQETFEKLTGTREMSATAIIEYFQPLLGWLETQNAGRKCGWE